MIVHPSATYSLALRKYKKWPRAIFNVAQRQPDGLPPKTVSHKKTGPMGRFFMQRDSGLAHASLAQGRWGVIAFLRRVVELVRTLLFVLHTQSQVTTRQQVIQGLDAVPRHLLVVVVLSMGFSHTPQGTATVIVVDGSSLPGIFVEVEVALGIDMTLTRFQGCSHMPYAVQLVTGQVLVDMASLDDLVILQLRRVQTVAVVRNVDFLLTVELPLVTVRCTVVHVEVVGSTQTVSSGTWTVIRNLRRTTHAALTGVVQPRQTGLFHLVKGFVYQQHVTGQTRRSRYALFEVEQYVAWLAGIGILQRTTEGELILEVHQAIGAVRLRSRLGDQTLHAATTVAGDVVPDGFQTVLGNREGVSLLEVLQTVTALDHLGVDCVVLRSRQDKVRHGSSTMGREHRHFVAFRITLEHRQLARGQLVFVLIDVLRSDGEQRLLTRERVREEARAIGSTSTSWQTASPGWDRTIRITSHFRTDWRQRSTQFGSFIRRYRRHHTAGQQRECQGAGLQQTFCCFHSHSRPQNLVRLEVHAKAERNEVAVN